MIETGNWKGCGFYHFAACVMALLLQAGMAQARLVETVVNVPREGGADNLPRFVAVDASGDIYFSDSSLRIRKLAADGRVLVFAGTGKSGYFGDGEAALNASLTDPKGVAFDSMGNMYFADEGSHVVRKVDKSGNIQRYAGTGNAGYSGDGGMAVSAALNHPVGISIDADGNMFIADKNNHAVRKVDLEGRISTVAGNGQGGYQGDGGVARAAKLWFPVGVAVDSQKNVYIVDRGNFVVRKVDAGGTITTFAGGGSRRSIQEGDSALSLSMGGPYGIAVDAMGGIYVSDSLEGVVLQLDSAGTIKARFGRGDELTSWRGELGDGGPADSARFEGPSGVAVTANGDLLIVDYLSSNIRRVIAGTASYTVRADGGIKSQSISVSMSPAVGLAGQPGALFVAVKFEGGQIYFLSPMGWTALREGAPAAYSTGLLAPHLSEIVSKQDLSGMVGATIYVGYGRGDSVEKCWKDMLKNLTFKKAYVVN